MSNICSGRKKFWSTVVLIVPTPVGSTILPPRFLYLFFRITLLYVSFIGMAAMNTLRDTKSMHHCVHLQPAYWVTKPPTTGLSCDD